MTSQKAEAYLQLGRSCRLQGRLSEAETALRQALECDPQNGGVRFELGALYLGQNRFIEAAAEFERAIAIDPHMKGAHGQLGRIYRGQGRSSEAEAALNKALELDPQDGGVRFELGVLYECQGKFLQAAVEFEKIIAMDPNHGGAYRQLGRICRRQGRSSEAEAALNKALEFDAQDGGARFELCVLYESQSKFLKAAAELEKTIAIDPNHGWAHFQLGRIYRRQGRLSEAATEFERAIAIDPHDAEAHLCLGQLHLRLGQWAGAEAEFQRAASLSPDKEGAYIGLWAAYRGQERTVEAGAALAKAMAITPMSAMACTELWDRLDRDRAIGGDVKEPPRERVFCLLPWMHLHVRMDGLVRPCCIWRGPPLADIRASSLDELCNSAGMKALRSDMMSGRPVAGCGQCYEDERFGFRSMRQKKNIEWAHHRGRERLTAPDGTLPRLPAVFLDLRFSNACNLRCRTCDSTQSSAWAADARALSMRVGGGPIQKPYDDWDRLWRQLQPLLEEGIEEIHFVGGEPLIMEEHYRILDFLIARKRKDVRLHYSTNFSTLRFQDWDVIGLWSHFRNVHVVASLDGSGRRGEYIRKGLRWEAVVANREEMLRRCPDVVFSIAVALSIFNALHLPDFHREWVEKGFIHCDALALNRVLTPEIYRTQVLSAGLKQQVLESYQRHRESFLDADGIPARDFAAAARFMAAEDRSGLLPEFVAMTRRLDRLRGEDCREVFPELAALFEATE